MTSPAPLAVASSAPSRAHRAARGVSVLPALRRVVEDAGGCPATAPSAIALGLAWRVRADALFLAPAHAAASPHPDVRRGAPRLRRLAQTWASGAARLVRDCEPGPSRLGWLQNFFAARAALLSHEGHEGAAWAVMGGELAVWRLRRSILPPDPPTTRSAAPITATPRGARART